MEQMYEVKLVREPLEEEKCGLAKEEVNEEELKQLKKDKENVNDFSQEAPSPESCLDRAYTMKDMEKQTEEGQVAPIIRSQIRAASYLSEIIDGENRYIGDRKFVAKDGKIIEVKKHVEHHFDPNAIDQAQTRSQIQFHKPLFSPANKSTADFDHRAKQTRQNGNEAESQITKAEVSPCNDAEANAKKELEIVSESSPEEEQQRRDETPRPNVERVSLQIELTPPLLRFNKPEYKVCKTYVDSTEPKDFKRMCMTELNDSSDDLITTRRLIRGKVRKVVVVSIVRDYVLAYVGLVLSAVAFYYVASKMIETRSYIVKAWIILTLIIVLCVLLVWNTVYAVVLGMLGYAETRVKTGVISNALRVVIPRSVRSMMAEYSLRCQ
eukprot:TRINITY_DN11193_c0_g1_i1.p1 TRINITY_DN11193_c0_g1~~TRINITY_DN11193_c0_g1_i1.p1  ORF type:complete len:381 (+),score=94.45 TRINITY_DN11193_c0_g1_i1:153-1295(+)